MQLKPLDSEALEAVLEVNRLLSICIYVATLIHIPLFSLYSLPHWEQVKYP